ncbi:MAG: hypothetical protein AB9919_12370 [Geobacteraceae bacterium]
MSYISSRRRDLSKRHYIRKAGAWNFWFDFTRSKVEDYRRRFGTDFCLVVNNSDSEDRAYIIPFVEVIEYFNELNLERDGRRWVGTIIMNRLKLGPAEVSIPVGRYFNRFDLFG